MPTLLFLAYALAAFLVTFFVALLYQTVIYCFALKYKRNDLADVAWGFGFVLLGFFWLLASIQATFAFKIALFCIAVWGLRLTFHIGNRFLSHKKEDRRYAAWRKEWKWVKTRSYFQVFVLQAFLMSIILLPLILHANFGKPVSIWLVLLGFLIWCTGFYFQVAGDYQLQQFLKKRSSKGKLMTEGLWGKTRHPNYFGEMTMWWGVFVILFAPVSVAHFVVTLVGPLTITLLLRFVSGVPMLENHWKEKYPDQFKQYAADTPMLFPKLFKK